MKKVVLIGCVKFSECVLQEIVDKNLCNLVGVCTRTQSSINSDAHDLAPTCNQNNIDVLYVDNINSISSINWISDKKPDIILCVGWSRLLSSEVLAIAKERCIGFHPSLLPHNRGRHPLIWALALGLEKTGTS